MVVEVVDDVKLPSTAHAVIAMLPHTLPVPDGNGHVQAVAGTQLGS